MFYPYDCSFAPSPPLNQGILGMSFLPPSFNSFEGILNKTLTVNLCQVGGKMWIGEPDTTNWTAPMKYVDVLGMKKTEK